MEEVKTMHDWDVFVKKTGKRNIHDYLKPGDTVSEDIVRYLINIVPPWNLKEGYFQVGTQNGYKIDAEGKAQPTYMTFEKDSTGGWKYKGNCLAGE